MVPVMVELAQEQFEIMKKRGVTNILEDCQELIGQVVGRVFFGADFKDYRIEGKTVPHYLNEGAQAVFMATRSVPSLVLGIKFINKGLIKEHREILKTNADWIKFTDERINERREQIKKELAENGEIRRKKYLIDFLIMNEIENSENSFTNREIADEFSTFYLAGMDTTAHLITMGTYYLQKYPDTLEKLRKEADLYLSNPSEITAETIAQMNYAHAVMNETLRLGTPGSRTMFRVAEIDHILGDLQIKKGTLVCTDSISNNFSPDYHDDPFVFNPERFLDENSRTRRAIKKDGHVFFPFSSGPRNCVGQHLATIESKLILGLLAKDFDWKLRDGYQLKIVMKFMHAPEEDLVYKLTPRKRNFK